MALSAATRPQNGDDDDQLAEHVQRIDARLSASISTAQVTNRDGLAAVLLYD